MSMTYAGVGVNYDGALDPFKRSGQSSARETASNLERFGYKEVAWTRGESCYLYETPDTYRGRVNEGLGTKNMVADEMYRLTGETYYTSIAQDTIAMIVNDMITAGCRPITVDMHVAAGSSKWFEDEKRCVDLVEGWRDGCKRARCTWAGGETPMLKGMVESNTVILSGSADGEVGNKSRVINPTNIVHGDAIVIIESSGIHANGITLARRIGERRDGFWQKVGHLFFPRRFPLQALPNGYLTKLSDGRTYGETLLDPTHIYVGLVEDCLDAGVDIHYAVNVTGHGWRKFMRATQPFTYVIDTLPTQLPIFDFIQEQGPVDDLEAYGNFNMGAGFALYVAGDQAAQVIDVAKGLGLRAFVAGHIEEGEKKVVIDPKGLEFAGETLAVR